MNYELVVSRRLLVVGFKFITSSLQLPILLLFTLHFYIQPDII